MVCIQCFYEAMQKTMLSTLLGINCHHQVFGRDPEVTGIEPLLTRRWVKARQRGYDLVDYIRGLRGFKQPHVCDSEASITPIAQQHMVQQEHAQPAAVWAQPMDYFGPFVQVLVADQPTEVGPEENAGQIYHFQGIQGTQPAESEPRQAAPPGPAWFNQGFGWEGYPEQHAGTTMPETGSQVIRSDAVFAQNAPDPLNFVPRPIAQHPPSIGGQHGLGMLQDWMNKEDTRQTMSIEECRAYGIQPSKRIRLGDWD